MISKVVLSIGLLLCTSKLACTLERVKEAEQLRRARINLPGLASRNQRQQQRDRRYKACEGPNTRWETGSYWHTAEYGHGKSPSWCRPYGANAEGGAPFRHFS